MTRPDLDLAHLRLFVVAVEDGISSAALTLGCSEEDARDGLRALERRYGHPLLTDDGPTGDGRRLLARARHILSLVDSTADALDRGALPEADGAGDTLMLRDLLGDAVGCISEGFVLFDPDGRLVLCNDRYRAAYPLLADLLKPGISFADLLRTALDRGAGGQVINPTLWVEERLRRHFDSDAPTNHRLGDGRWYRISEHATRFGGIVKVLTDITELKRHEEALANSEARYRQLVEAAPYGIVVWDGVRVRFANHAAAEMLGTGDSDGMLTRPVLSDPAAPGAGDLLFAHLPPPCVERAPGPPLAVRVDPPDDPVRDLPARDLEVGVHPFAIDGVPAWLLVLNDVTQRKQAERALNQAQKMQAIGQLAGGIAHEFNNMLTAIGGFAHMARRAPADRRRVEQCLGEIIKATDRAAGLTSQLLTFGRQEPGGAARPVTVAPQLEEARRFLRPILGEQYSLDIDIRAADAVVLIEPAQLHQSLVNLAINSRDAMPGGGPITITLDRTIPDAAFWRRHAGLRRGTYVTIQVRDGGEGIAAEVIDRIFEPFFTTKGQGEGTGLGLSLVYSTVTRAGGAVEVWSEPGQGTAITLYFPAERGTLGYGAGVDGGDAEAPAEEAEDGPSVAATVLLVEDEEQVRDFIRLTLEDMGMRVVTAADGEEALALFHQQGGAFDLMVSDLVMPRMGGAELARRLREEAGDLPVVLMSGYPPEIEPLNDLLTDTRRVAFLHKPVNPDALAARIHALVV